MKAKPEIEINASTEEKIKDAARRVFTRKGFAATRTRDIAEESGYNLALINYYFRSKEKLFDIIMLEHMQTFIHSVMGIVNDTRTSLEEKITVLISHYIDMLKDNPDLPIFVLGAIHEDPKLLMTRAGFDVNHDDIYLVKQWKEMAAGNKPVINPLHLILNVLSMTIFPFIASPLFRSRVGINLDQFNALMEERKTLIPIWVNAMMEGDKTNPKLL